MMGTDRCGADEVAWTIGGKLHHVPFGGLEEDFCDQRSEVGGQDDIVFEDEGGRRGGVFQEGSDGEHMAHVAAPFSGRGVLAVAAAVAGIVEIGPGQRAELASVDGGDASKWRAAFGELSCRVSQPLGGAV